MADFWTNELASTKAPDDGQSGYVTPTTFGENFEAAFQSQKYLGRMYSQKGRIDDAYSAREQQIFELTGERGIGGTEWSLDYYDKLAKVREKHPEVLDDTQLIQSVYSKARESELVADEVAQSATLSGQVGAFIGGTVSSLTLEDPVNVATLPLGWGRSILTRALSNTALGGVSEAINQFTGVQAWRQEVGARHGLNVAMNDIVMASVGAGAGGAALELTGKLAGKTLEQLQRMRANRNLDASEKAVLSRLEQGRLEQEISQLSDEELLQVARERLPEDAISYQERAAQAALEEAVGIRKTMPFDAEQKGAAIVHKNTLSDAAAALMSEEKLATMATPPAALGINQKAFDGVAGKTEYGQFTPAELELDPSRFQFKADTDATGANLTLKKVKSWNPDLAGTIMVFEQADGRRFVADGHQRVNLAKRLQAEDPSLDIRINAIVKKEIDGWTAERSMAYAAGINMVQGTGTNLDAARILRSFPDYLPGGGLADNAVVRDARGLARVSQDAFDMVVNDSRVNPTYAAKVGQLVDDPALHAPILRQLTEEGPENAFQAEQMVRNMREDAFTTTSQATLFGEEQVVESLYKPKAKVLDRAMKFLREDKKTFATLVNRSKSIEGTGRNQLDRQTNKDVLNNTELALYNLQKLANRKGSINDALTQAAKSAKETGQYASQAREFAEYIKQAIRDGSIERDADGVFSPDAANREEGQLGQTRADSTVQQIDEVVEADTQSLVDDISEQLGLPTAAERADALEATPTIQRSDGGPVVIEGVVVPADAVHPRKGLTYPQALEQMLAKKVTVAKPSDYFNATPERVALREKIMDEVYGDGAAKKERIVNIVMGPPGAGKSSVVVNKLKDEFGALELDSDIIKTKLPEFDDGIGANAVHEESAMMLWDANLIDPRADTIIRRALINGDNIVYPIVGKSSGKVLAQIDAFKAAGYKVNLSLVDLPAEVSAARVVARYKSTGRLLPPRYVLSIGDAPQKAFYEIIQKGNIDEYAHFDNNVGQGEKPILISTNNPERYGQPRNDAGRETVPGRDRPADAGLAKPGSQSQEGRTSAVDDIDVPTGIEFDADGNMRVTLKKASDVLQDISDDDDLVSAVTRCAI